jgi:hypothetical protein
MENVPIQILESPRRIPYALSYLARDSLFRLQCLFLSSKARSIFFYVN